MDIFEDSFAIQNRTKRGETVHQSDHESTRGHGRKFGNPRVSPSVGRGTCFREVPQQRNSDCYYKLIKECDASFNLIGIVGKLLWNEWDQIEKRAIFGVAHAQHCVGPRHASTEYLFLMHRTKSLYKINLLPKFQQFKKRKK